MLEEAVFGLPHEQKSILVDAAQLKRSKKSHDTECTPVETEPVHMDHVHTSAGNVMATGFERIQREKRKKKKEKRKKKKGKDDTERERKQVRIIAHGTQENTYPKY